MLNMQNYIVIYLDVLGAKKIIENDGATDFLNTIQSLYKDVSFMVNMMMPMSGIDDCKFKIFSDNIVIAIPSDHIMRDDHHPVIAINRAETTACFLQREFLKKNILLRGGMTYGKFYIDDVFVWGKALIDAYEIEDRIAIYPRIVIDKSILKKQFLNFQDDKFQNELISMYNVKEDFDGEYFFDYLNYPQDKGVCELVNNSLEYVTKIIGTEKDKKILQKYVWHKNYLLSCKSAIHCNGDS